MVSKKKRKKENFVLNIFISVLVIIAIFLSMVYFLQDDAIFVKQPISDQRVRNLRLDPNVDEINISINEKTNLHGWLLNNSETKRTIIYFGGNAEEVSWIIDRRDEFKNWDVLAINYRGYGLSNGNPTEKNLYKDSLKIYDEIIKDRKEENEVIIKGRSIGTGVSTYLAGKREHDGIILVSPFDNLHSVVQETIPVPRITELIRHKFNSIDNSKNVTTPLLMIISEDDEIVPNHLSKRFYDSWEGEREKTEISGFDHNEMHLDDKYWNDISNFIKKIIE